MKPRCFHVFADHVCVFVIRELFIVRTAVVVFKPVAENLVKNMVKHMIKNLLVLVLILVLILPHPRLKNHALNRFK